MRRTSWAAFTAIGIAAAVAIPTIAFGNARNNTGNQHFFQAAQTPYVMRLLGTNESPIGDQDGNGIIDGDDYLEIGGIGGTTVIPFILLEKVTIPTNEGVDLVFSDVEMGVLDVPGITGVIGMNFLTTGYLDIVFNGGSEDEFGAFSDVLLDFTSVGANGLGAGVMTLEMNPAYNNVIVPEPSFDAISFLFASTLLRRRPR